MLRHTAMVFDNAPPNTLAAMLGVLETRTSWEGEMHARRPDSSEYDSAITVAPVFEADGTIAHLVGVFRDITATKQVDRMRKKFVANVSHELRTPITNIKLFHTLLHSGPVDRRPDYLQTMAGEIARLERLVEDLLDISRLTGASWHGAASQPANQWCTVVRSHQPRRRARRSWRWKCEASAQHCRRS
jgi:signal transduction histidine kinase